MTRLRVASLNLSGVQGPGEFARFTHACRKLAERDGVDVVLGQEHNLNPARQGDLSRLAEARGFGLVIGFDVRGADGVHWGGTLVMVRLSSTGWPELRADRDACVVIREPGAVVVQIDWHGRKMYVGSVYAPVQPTARVDFFQRMRGWVTPDMILGGDWNCVPDVTLDVQSSDPSRYRNIGSSLLGEVMAGVGLYDFRRSQLRNDHEATRCPLGEVRTRTGPDVVMTRLDRFYIPTNDRHDDLLPSFTVRWDILWSKETRDHAAIILDLEDAVGEAGHARHTIREDITSEYTVQEKIKELTDAAYDKGGKEWQKWERAECAIKDYLLKETARRRVRERVAITQAKTELSLLMRRTAKKGPTATTIEMRRKLTEKLFSLEHPETKNEECLKRQVASAQMSDVSTRRFFSTYKTAAKSQWINAIKKADWVDGVEPTFTGHTTTPKEVPSELAKYWGMIYGRKRIDEDAARDLLEGCVQPDGTRKGGMSDRKLSQPSVDIMEAEITDAEVLRTIAHLPLGKSAGPNRIPNGVYKHLSSYYAPKLGAVIREAVDAAALPPSFLLGDITLLYKKDERDDSRHYRPITLLQNAYKVFTRILAKRMKRVVHEIISECQKGFVPHAFIAECSMLMNLIEAYINDDDHPDRGGMMLFLDMEKAFDRVSYDFLLKSIDACGFGPRFQQTVRMMYDVNKPPQRRIYANGFYSAWFSIQSGVAQGCPLSPLLFLLVAQALKVAIAQNPDFHGIKIGKMRTKISQFADDTSLFLRGPQDMREAQACLDKWCKATAMRENLKKREGLAMGRYRNRVRLPRGVKWKKDGEFAIVLGSPVGNRMNHDGWWKKKVIAIQGRAQRFIGLFRASYFGRNLIVQSKYFGALRYWLYSIPMGRLIRAEVKQDADTLWWSRTPDLGEPRVRFRRWVAKRTAIGPRGRGGLNNMDWDGHVQAVLAEWVLRWIMPPDRDVCAWKHVLYHMVMVDKQGYDKFPEGRNIFFCKMSLADKVRLMRGIPKHATYIKSCIRAFWQLHLTQDLDVTTHLRAESFWHNARFTLDAAYIYPRARARAKWKKELRSYSTLIDVQCLGDVVDSATGQLRTRENWAAWVEWLYEDETGKQPDEDFVDAEADRLHQLASQVPQHLLQTIREQSSVDYAPKPGEIVTLVKPNVQDQEPVYATHRAGRYEECTLDAYNIPHPTGVMLDSDGLRVMKVAVWRTRGGVRIRGAADAVFPCTSGWLLDGTKVELDRLSVSKMTKASALKKFIPPASEAAWKSRVSTELCFQECWKIKRLFATPRDTLTWLKLQHRTLYTIGHDTSTDGLCRACTESENQQHLMRCDVIQDEYWQRVLRLLQKLGMDLPENREAFLITGQLNASTIADAAYTDIVAIAWRCLYAAIVQSRLDDTPLALQGAYERAVKMIVGRVRAYGEKWRAWVNAGRNCADPRCIPLKHRDKTALVFDEDGGYELHDALLNEVQQLGKDPPEPTQDATAPAQQPPRHRSPPSPPHAHPPRAHPPLRAQAPTPQQIVVRGDMARLRLLLGLPGLPRSRTLNLTSLRNSMDAQGNVVLTPMRPNTTGGVVGGRTTYKDITGATNILLSCHAGARSYIFGGIWDEIDISRSHVNAVFGCWEMAEGTSPISLTRHRTEPEFLESDVSADLRDARPRLEAELARAQSEGGESPSASQRQNILYAQKALQKCSLPYKKVLSAMINVKNPNSWRIPFDPNGLDRPSCVIQLLNDIIKMRAAVLKHPLCVAFVAALRQTGVAEPRIISLCLGHLDDCALAAARHGLQTAGCTTGLTINDSLFVQRPAPCTQDHIQTIASSAASSALGFPVTFAYLPHLMKEGEPLPTLRSLTNELARPGTAEADAEENEPNEEEDEFGAAAPATALRAADPHVTQPRPQEEQAEGDPEDEWRDMSGDALTTCEAIRRGLHAQCPLAATRNVRRDPSYTRARLAERQIPGTSEYPNDIRFVDWPIILGPLVNPGEVIKRATLEHIEPADLLDFRVAVVRQHTHVGALINDEDGAFRLYDNDSPESRLGTFCSMRADEVIMNWTGICGVLLDGSALSGKLGPAITTLQTRQRERNAPLQGGQPTSRARQGDRRDRQRPLDEPTSPPQATRARHQQGRDRQRNRETSQSDDALPPVRRARQSTLLGWMSQGSASGGSQA